MAQRMDPTRATSESAVLSQYAILSENGILLTRLRATGGQGSVYHAIKQGNVVKGKATQSVAVKIVKKAPSDLSTREHKLIKMHMEREIEILRVINHHKCLRFIECIEDEENWFIVTEYLAGVDLHDQASRKVLSELEILRIAHQVLEALKYLHSIGIAHRDVKLENIVFCRGMTSTASRSTLDCKLIDFGFAYYDKFDQSQSRATLEVPGTTKYLSPELIEKTCIDPCKVDIWAVGVLMYVLLTGKFPFDQAQASKKKESYSQPAWKSISKKTRELVQSLLNKDPALRVGATEAITMIDSILPQETPKSNKNVALRPVGNKTPMPNPPLVSPASPASNGVRLVGRIAQALKI